MANKFLNSRDTLAYLAVIYNGDWSKIYNEIIKHLDYDYDTVMEVVNGISTKFITILDEEYPNELKQVSHPPFVLFYKGDISLIKDVKQNLAVNGNRTPTLEAQYVAKYLLKDNIGKNIVVGASKGLTLQMVYEGSNKFIVVLPCGIDNNEFSYALSNCDNVLLISEYPNNVPLTTEQALARQRIVVGLSTKTLILEAHKNSNAMVLVNLSLSYNHEVMVVPTNISTADDYCNNQLIYEGATIVLNKDMLLEQLELD